MSKLCLQKEYSKKIREALSRDQLILFVGAGVSQNSGFPSWNDVVCSLKQELCEDLEHINDATKIAELYELQFNRIDLEKKIQSLFPVNSPPSKIHKLIIEIKPKYIITTNQDTLLEQAIGSSGVFYDVIADDEELVRSTLPNKIIKMHGDFPHHNIVFTENDYINYSRNFPLIENTLKSLLCTHTVVFLGYSYNDSTLKQINSWITVHSKSSPTMYMVMNINDYTELEAKYLEQQNITTIVIGDKGKEKGNYIKPLITFLENIVNNIRSSRDRVYDFIDQQIDVFSSFNTIYHKFLINTFSNIGVRYDWLNQAYLWLYIKEGSFDQNMYLRKYYRQFMQFSDQLISQKNPKFQFMDPIWKKIIPILEKTDLYGIYANIESEDKYLKRTEIEEKELRYYSFDYEPQNNQDDNIQKKLSELYYHYNLHNYQESLELAREIITLAQQTQQYIWAFIAMFNYNTLLKRFHYEITREKVDNQQITNVEMGYDLDKVLESFPLQYRDQVREINKFLNFKYISSDLYQVSTGLEEIMRDRKKIEQGYRILRNEGFGFSYKHRNMINFILDNFIFMEDYDEFKLLNKHYLAIAIDMQFQKESVTLSNMEIYACIRYLTKEQLSELFKEFIEQDNKSRHIAFQENQKLWMLETVWNNISRYYPINHRSKFESYIINCIFMISIVEWTDNELKRIVGNCSHFIKNQHCTIGFFEAINLFIGFQYKLFNKLLPDKSEETLLDSLLYKIISQSNNFFEYQSLTDGYTISNIFASFHEKKNKYDNTEYAKELISMLRKQEIKEQILVSTRGLPSFYDISSNGVQQIISEYWIQLVGEEESLDHSYIEFYYTLLLHLQQRELYPLSPEQWELLKNYYIESKSISSQSSTIYQLCKLILEISDKTSSYIDILEEIIESIKRNMDRYRRDSF